MTNDEKMLRLVLSDERLSSYYDFDPDDYIKFDDALNSQNAIVKAIALIIIKVSASSSNKGVYDEVFNFLKRELDDN